MCSIEKIPAYWWVSNFFSPNLVEYEMKFFLEIFPPFLMIHQWEAVSKTREIDEEKKYVSVIPNWKTPDPSLHLHTQYEYVNVYKFRWYGYWLLERPILLPTYLILRKISWNSVTIWFHEFFSAWILFLKNFPTLSLKTIQWYKHIFSVSDYM